MSRSSDSVSGYRIRPAKEEDADAISDVLLQASLAAWGWFVGYDRIEAANRGQKHPADLVAEDGDGVFAFVSWDDRSGEIVRLYTHPRGQGRGAGAALLEAAEDALRKAGCTEAWLNTEERGTATRRFYERRGWVESGPPRVRDWHGVRLTEPRYAKQL